MAIKIFVSWSGDKSYQLAEKLHEWLPTIVPDAKVFFLSGSWWGDNVVSKAIEGIEIR